MELSTLLIQFKGLLFLFGCIWGIFILLNFFHFGYNFWWKLIILIVYILFIFFYFPYLYDEYLLAYNQTREFFKQLLQELVLLLNYFDFFIFFLWPIIMIYSFFTAREKRSLDFIKIFIVITLIYWIFLMVKNNPSLEKIIKTYFLKLY
jgi:hypothetical protein